MQASNKKVAYTTAIKEINAVLAGEVNMVMKMATINCILKTHLPYYFWVGFYCVHQNSLIVGPYQGTLGCLHIPFNKGVCGRAARFQKTQIVENVHSDPEHLACDSRTNSEIVLPVFNKDGNLIAVFDVDSTEPSSFDIIDQEYLERILEEQFTTPTLEMAYSL